MLAPLDTLDHLKARLRELRGEILSTAGDGVLSLILALPEPPSAPPPLAGPGFSFMHTHRDELYAGYGSAGQWQAAGPGRLSDLRLRAKGLSRSWRQLDPDETGFAGFAMLGFAARPSAGDPPPADGLPNALLWLPEAALCSRRGQAALVLSTRHRGDRTRLIDHWCSLLDRLVPRLFLPAPGPLNRAPLRLRLSKPDRTRWLGLVQAARAEIAAGSFDKVVLARRLTVEGSRRFDLARLQGALRFLFPSCQVIHIRRGAASFVAATPERLLSLRGNRVEVDALAGTASRAAETLRDDALSRALRRSGKNLHEHRVVVEAIVEALEGTGSRVEAPPTPGLMQLNNVQHLWTRIATTLHAPSDAFVLAELLHPTPATNGHPRRAADRWLERTDAFERGWYTGAAGIVHPDLSGELYVLLRCARLRARVADLCAGAGIVAESEPRAEWRETEHKLDAMLSALQFA
jgi:menaquinone-specific isochorismate synthase